MGEMCVANFIPPANGASLGSYLVKNCLFCPFWPSAQAIPAPCREKKIWDFSAEKISDCSSVHQERARERERV